MGAAARVRDAIPLDRLHATQVAAEKWALKIKEA